MNNNYYYYLGAMYSFPRVTLPPAFIAEAKRLDKAPDVLYCLQLLEETGLSCVPGSGFRQVEGTFHIRTTILVSWHVNWCIYTSIVYVYAYMHCVNYHYYYIINYALRITTIAASRGPVRWYNRPIQVFPRRIHEVRE